MAGGTWLRFDLSGLALCPPAWPSWCECPGTAPRGHRDLPERSLGFPGGSQCLGSAPGLVNLALPLPSPGDLPWPTHPTSPPRPRVATAGLQILSANVTPSRKYCLIVGEGERLVTELKEAFHSHINMCALGFLCVLWTEMFLGELPESDVYLPLCFEILTRAILNAFWTLISSPFLSWNLG